MSWDQAYLYRIFKAIVTGSKQFSKGFDEGLLTASPGKLHNARFTMRP